MEQTEQTTIVHSGGYYVKVGSYRLLLARDALNGTTTTYEYIETVK